MRGIAVVGVLWTVAWFLRGPAPDPGEIGALLAGAEVDWLIVAALVIAMSMMTFGLQQRYLLALLGTRVSVGRAFVLALAQTAVSTAVPAGSVVAIGFTFRQFRSRGADAGSAASVVALSGLFSWLGLATVYAIGAGITAGDIAPPILFVALVAGTFCLPRAARRYLARWPHPPATGSTGWSWTALRSAARHRARQLATSVRSLSGRHCLAVGALATLNWLGDIACLVSVARALHCPLDVGAVAIAFFAGQIARLIPLTPGGVGVVEATLLAVFIAGGAEVGQAAAVIGGYRFLSCWVVVIVGLPLAIVLSRAAGTGRPRSAEPADPRVPTAVPGGAP